MSYTSLWAFTLLTEWLMVAFSMQLIGNTAVIAYYLCTFPSKNDSIEIFLYYYTTQVSYIPLWFL